MEIWLKSVLMNLKMDMLHTYPACKEIFYTILKMNRILGNILRNILGNILGNIFGRNLSGSPGKSDSRVVIITVSIILCLSHFQTTEYLFLSL